MNIPNLMKKTLTLAYALFNGKSVSKERISARVEICSTCDLVRVQGDDENGLLRCGICGCKVGESALINLARYEETGAYGCKHPDGSKWQKAGV